MSVVVFFAESELDAEIQEGRFFSIFEEVDSTFEDLHYRLSQDLECLLVNKYGEERVFVSDDTWRANALKVEVVVGTMNRDFIELLDAFLKKKAVKFCIGVAVYHAETLNADSNYIGRILINRHEIAVEDTLAHVWPESISPANCLSCFEDNEIKPRNST